MFFLQPFDPCMKPLMLMTIPQNLLPGTHLFCVYGDNWFQSVRWGSFFLRTFFLYFLFRFFLPFVLIHRPLTEPLASYKLRCLVAVPPDTDCVTTIKSTEEKLAGKKKELESFQVRINRYFIEIHETNLCLSRSFVRSRRSTMPPRRGWRTT